MKLKGRRNTAGLFSYLVDLLVGEQFGDFSVGIDCFCCEFKARSKTQCKML